MDTNDLYTIRDAAIALREDGADDLSADLDAVGDKLAEQLKLELDTKEQQ